MSHAFRKVTGGHSADLVLKTSGRCFKGEGRREIGVHTTPGGRGQARDDVNISICQIKVFIASLFNIPCSFIILSQNT